MAILCNDTHIPLTIEFIIGEGEKAKKQPITHIWNTEKQARTNDPIELKESIPVGITFYADNQEFVDEEVTINIESSLYNQEGEQKIITVPLQPTNDIYWIYQFNQKGPYPWRMGCYFFYFIYKDTKYVATFYVVPIHLTIGQVQKIHNYLENEIEGICYELIYSNKSYVQATFENYKLSWYHEYARWIQNEYGNILISLDYIEKHAHESIKKEYRLMARLGKQDFKTEKWNSSNKLAVQNKSFSSLFVMNKTKIMHFNSPPNQWIKNVGLKWIAELEKIILLIEEELEVYQKKEENQIVSKIRIEKKKEELKYVYDVAEERKVSFEINLRTIERNIKNIRAYRATITKSLTIIKNLYHRLSYFVHQTFLIDVDRGKKQPTLKNPFYYQFNKLYETSKTFRKQSGEIQMHHPILKPTWRIYEYFVLFKVMEIIKDSGYTNVSGITPEFLINLQNHRVIQEGCQFVFENEHSSIEVWYEKRLSISDDAVELNEAFYSSKNICPDIRIDYYWKKEKDVSWFLGSLIIDAKHRKFKSLVRGDYYTEVQAQLTDYFSIFYRQENTDRKMRNKPVTQKVLCVYSRDKNMDIKKVVHPITYIQMFPEIDDTEEFIVTIGYTELKKELSEWFSDLQYDYL